MFCYASLSSAGSMIYDNTHVKRNEDDHVTCFGLLLLRRNFSSELAAMHSHLWGGVDNWRYEKKQITFPDSTHATRRPTEKNGTQKEDPVLPALSPLLVILCHFVLLYSCYLNLICSTVFQCHVQRPLPIRFQRGNGLNSHCIRIGGHMLQYAPCVSTRFRPKKGIHETIYTT